MESTYEKVSDTEYKEIKPQPPIEEVKSLDELIQDRASIAEGLANNQAQVEFLTTALEDIDNKILAIKALGVKTQDEVTIPTE